MASLEKLQSSETCVSSFSPVTLSNTEDLRKWLVQDSHASLSLALAVSSPQKMSETCGLPPGTLFAWYDQQSHGLKMSQASLLPDTAKSSSETWPSWGTMLNGECFQVPAKEPRIAVTGSSALPTIGANEYRGTSSKRWRGSPDYHGAKMAEGMRTGPDDPAYLNPCFGDWVMGWVTGWSDLKPLGTDKFQSWLRQLGVS